MSLENIVNNEPSSKGWLARKLNNPHKGLLGKILDYATGLTGTAFAYSVIGVPALVAAGISIAGDYFGNKVRKAKTTSSQIRDSLLFSALLSPITYSAMSWLNNSIDIKGHYGLLKRTAAQIGIFQGIIGPPANHLDYMIRHKTLNVKEAYEKQFKKFFFKNAGWAALAGLVPVSLAYQGADVTTQFYGGLAAMVAVRGLAWGRQIAALNPYGTYNNRSAASHGLAPQYS